MINSSNFTNGKWAGISGMPVPYSDFADF